MTPLIPTAAQEAELKTMLRDYLAGIVPSHIKAIVDLIPDLANSDPQLQAEVDAYFASVAALDAIKEAIAMNPTPSPTGGP